MTPTQIIEVIEPGPRGPAGSGGEVTALEHNTTYGVATLGTGGVSITVDTVWGIHNGVPYYDPDGAASGEQAVLIINDDGDYAVVAV